jgi:hypothetical protein
MDRGFHLVDILLLGSLFCVIPLAENGGCNILHQVVLSIRSAVPFLVAAVVVVVASRHRQFKRAIQRE